MEQPHRSSFHGQLIGPAAGGWHRWREPYLHVCGVGPTLPRQGTRLVRLSSLISKQETCGKPLRVVVGVSLEYLSNLVGTIFLIPPILTARLNLTYVCRVEQGYLMI